MRTVTMILLLACVPASASSPAGDTDFEDFAQQARVEHRATIRAFDARGDADALLVAALLDYADGASYGGETSPDARVRQVERLQRLQRIAGSDPTPLLVAAGLAVDLDDALHASLVQRLLEVDPGNAAAWAHELAIVGPTLDEAAMDAQLAAMARSVDGFSMHSGPLVAAIRDALAAAPAWDYARGVAEQEFGHASEQAARWVQVLGVWLVSPQPPLQQLVHACRPAQGERLHAARASACRTIGRAMARQSDTYIGQRIGIRLWLHAVEGTSEEARARSAKRDSVWRMTAGTALMHDQDTGLPDVDVYERVWMTEALGEIEAHEMLLEEAGLPLTAPEDFDASSLLESMSSEAAAPAG